MFNRAASKASRWADVLPARKVVKMLPTDAVRKYARENKISIVKFDAMMEFARWFERPYYAAAQHGVQLTAFLAGLGVGVFVTTVIAIVVINLYGCR